MSRKTVAFSAPAPRPPAADAKPASPAPPATEVTEAWVRERAVSADPGVMDLPLAAALTIDLAAPRTLAEVYFLSFFTPMALGWFWLLHAMAGRARF